MKFHMLQKGLMFGALNSVFSLTYAEEIMIHTDEWDGLTSAKEGGLLIDMMKEVFSSAKIEVKFEFFPKAYERTKKNVIDKKADAALLVYKGEIDKGALYSKSHIFSDKMMVVFQDKNPYKDEKSLSGKNVGWMRGYTFDYYLNEKSYKKQEFDDNLQGLKMLQRSRLDFFIGTEDELGKEENQKFMESSKLKMQDLKWIPAFVVFQDSPKGIQLQKTFDEAFSKLLASGSIKKLYEKHDLVDFYQY